MSLKIENSMSLFDRAKLGDHNAFCELKRNAKHRRNDTVYQLAQCYLKGWGVDVKLEKSAIKFSVAAQRGHPKSTYQLGCCFLYGIGKEVDYRQAAIWLYRSIKRGEVYAIDALRFLSNTGNHEAVYRLGLCYWNGHGVKENKELALEWFSKAASSGQAKALVCLVKMGDESIKKYIEKCFVGNDVCNSEASTWLYDSIVTELCADFGGMHFLLTEGNIDQDKVAIWLYHSVQTGEKQAFDLLHTLSNTGNGEAEYRLGCCYWKGYGVDIDKKLAIEWFSRAARSGHIKAEHQLGRCYWNGYGVDIDKNLALDWFLRAANKGLPGAIEEVARYYLKKTEKVEDAFYWAQKLANEGDSFYKKFVGFCLFEGVGVQKDQKKGLDSFSSKGKMHRFAGRAYEQGWGVKKDVRIATSRYLIALKLRAKQAVNGLTRLSSNGSMEAKFALAQCYLHGLGVERSEYNGAKKLLKAAGLGLLEAQLMLGEFYSKGELFQLDHKKAVYWFVEAEKGGSLEASYYLGICYLYGIVVEKDQEEGESRFPDLATLEHFFGTCLYEGKFFLKNQAAAMDLFKKSAELGLPKAQCEYGKHLQNGWHIKKDLETAFYWFSLAAQSGDAEAQYYLGACYLFGYGTEVDQIKAAECFNESAAQGHFNAKYFLGLCFHNGWGVEIDEAKGVTLS